MELKWLLLLSLVLSKTAGEKKIVCYYGSWAVYRPGDGKFDVEDIDPNVCTHINFAFLGINGDGSIRILDSWNEIDKSALKRFSCLKKMNPSLKTLLAIGGWNEGSVTFSNVVRSQSFRAKFIESALDLLKNYDFDGVDLDWEYPAQRGGTPEDVDNFTALLKEFREAFGDRRYLLTAAVASAKTSASQSYNISEISKYLDFINVMTYDLHGSWDQVTGHNSPLYASSVDETEFQRELNVDACINYWLGQGAPPNKLNLGIGLYGRTFTLANQNNNGLGATAYTGGSPGPYTRESGYLGYNEICVYLKEGGWTVVRDSDQKVPYAYKGNQWVGYDDQESIAIKAEYVKHRDLGGIMIWSVETDDFKANCGPRNSLLNTIRDGFGLEATSGDGWESECAPGNGGSGGGGGGGGNGTVSPPPPDNICCQVGHVRDPNDCGIFYYCEISETSWRVHTFHCPEGLYFDLDLLVCNWSNLVQCP